MKSAMCSNFIDTYKVAALFYIIVKMKGIYLAFEGGEGFGKSTQAKILFEKLKEKFPKRKIILTREPGGSSIAEEVREIILTSRKDEQIQLLTEAYLFAAARAQSLRESVVPVLEEGGIVISDRTFYSSIAYQGFGRELGWKKVWKINQEAVGKIKPDLVYLFDGDPKIGLDRICKNKRETNRLDKEKLEFHKRVRKGFLFLCDKEPKRFVTIDGCSSIEKQSEIIWAQFCRFNRRSAYDSAKMVQ